MEKVELDFIINNITKALEKLNAIRESCKDELTSEETLEVGTILLQLEEDIY